MSLRDINKTLQCTGDLSAPVNLTTMLSPGVSFFPAGNDPKRPWGDGLPPIMDMEELMLRRAFPPSDTTESEMQDKLLEYPHFCSRLT